MNPAAAVQGAQDQGTIELPPVDVTSRRIASPTSTIGAPPPAFAGGQVSTGGRQGLFGNRDRMDTPFTQNSYTEELLRNQQARTFGDAVLNDASVRLVSSPYAAQYNLFIRGISLNARDTAFDGVYGINNPRDPAIEGIERVEVLHGPGALLFGFAPSGTVAGVVNLVPKRAPDDPLTRITGGFLSNGNGGGSFDVARRYGADKQLGVRFNGAFSDGDTPIDRNSIRNGVFTAGIDYRGDRLRISFDGGYQNQLLRSPLANISVLPGFAVPTAPKLSSSVQQSWESSYYDNVFGLGKVEYDILPNVTAFASLGVGRSTEEFRNSSLTILNALGNVRFQPTSNRQETVAPTAEIGVRATVNTGPIKHTLSLIGTGLQQINYQNGFQNDGASFTTNLYAPVQVREPTHVALGTNLPLNSRNSFASIAVGDVLSVLDDKVQLTAGIRGQRVRTEGFDLTSGARTALYDQGKFTPVGGLLVRPWQPVSFYASYAEGFGFGPTAPSNAVNAGTAFPPITSKQAEVGAKFDFGTIGASVALFQITQPSSFTNPATRIFSVSGEQRNRGVETNVFGSPLPGLRLLAGLTYVDGVLTSTVGGTNNGKQAVGVPHVQFTANGEYDLPFVPGLTATARVFATSRQFVDQSNTQSIPSWARLDIGARYAFTAWQKPLVGRFNILNVTGENYWASSGGGSLALGQPRTFLFSISADL